MYWLARCQGPCRYIRLHVARACCILFSLHFIRYLFLFACFLLLYRAVNLFQNAKWSTFWLMEISVDISSVVIHFFCFSVKFRLVIVKICGRWQINCGWDWFFPQWETMKILVSYQNFLLCHLCFPKPSFPRSFKAGLFQEKSFLKGLRDKEETVVVYILLFPPCFLCHHFSYLQFVVCKSFQFNLVEKFCHLVIKESQIKTITLKHFHLL